MAIFIRCIRPLVAPCIQELVPKGRFDLSVMTGAVTGSFPVLVAIASLFAARGIWELAFYNSKGRFAQESQGSVFPIPLAWQRHLCSLPAAVILFIAIVVLFSSKYLTLAWGCEGLLLTVMGLAMRDRILRFLGLGLLAFCLAIVFFDLYTLDIDRIFKVMALIGLGLILIFTGWIYSRYREKIAQLIME